jgi:hypothetical protein
MAASGGQRMPSLNGATEWLNSEPLGLAGLRGHVVLVNFWTLTCINWLRTEPHGKLLIKPTAGARPASPRTPGRFIAKARTHGLTPDESHAARTTQPPATAPDEPTHRLSQTPDAGRP